MTDWTAERVARVLGGRAGAERRFSSISTDTRTLAADALYVALPGDRFDGHDFLDRAAAAGAIGAVVRTGTPAVAGLEYFEVDDTLAALGLLARERRRSIDGPVVAITGTNGKTSTKELVRGVLARRWTVHATRANYNNLVGVPLTVLEAPASCNALVVEAGANALGEIGRLRTIIEPTIGVVTNVSAGHLEGFRDLEGTLVEKTSLLVGLDLAVVGMHPPALAVRARALAKRVVTAGLDADADHHPEAWSVDHLGRVTLAWSDHEVRVPVLGRHQGENAMIALSVGAELGLPPAEAAAGVADVALPGGRCEMIECDGVRILNDTYNANPESVRASLETVRALRGGGRLVVAVGTMLELGEASERLHRETAQAILEIEPDLVGAVGSFVQAFGALGVAADRLVTADDAEELGRRLCPRLRGGDLVLLKGSRGVRLERAIPLLTPGSEASCSTTS